MADHETTVDTTIATTDYSEIEPDYRHDYDEQMMSSYETIEPDYRHDYDEQMMSSYEAEIVITSGLKLKLVDGKLQTTDMIIDTEA